MGKKRTETEWEEHKFPRESALQNYVMKRLRYLPNAYFFKVADRYTSGISDILGCVKGKFVAIELKVGYNKATPLQKAFIAIITKCGGVAGIAYNWGEVKTILKTAGYDVDKELRKESQG